jgi:hypothetical protein
MYRKTKGAVLVTPIVWALTVTRAQAGCPGIAPKPSTPAKPPAHQTLAMASPIVVDGFFSGLTAISALLSPAETVVTESVNAVGQQATGIKLGTPGDALNAENQAVIISNMTPAQALEYAAGMSAKGSNAK